MSGTDLTRIIHEKPGIDGTVPRTRFEVQDIGSDSELEGGVLIRLDGETITLAYLAHDFSPSDFWEDDEGAGEYRAFRRDDDPNALMADIRASGRIAFFVERYSHGLDHYSVAGTRGYPDRQWDVGCVGILTPCQDVQDRYGALCRTEGEAAALAEAVRDSNSVLQNYSDHCNGNVYGVVVETWKIEGQHVRALESEEVWGYIGAEAALAELKSTLPPQPAAEPDLMGP